MFHSLPVLRKTKAGGLDYGTGLPVRLAALGIGAAVFGLMPLLAAPGIPKSLFWMTGVIIASASLSEDRWILLPPSAEGEGGSLRRRYGLFPFTRSLGFELAEVEAIEFRGGAAGEPITGDGELRARIEASIYGTGRRPWRALVIKLGDGTSLVMTAGKDSDEARLRRDGKSLADFGGIAFRDLA